MSNPFRYFNSSPEVIRLVVMMYVRYPLSLRNVEDLLAERGIDISHETVRFWWQAPHETALSERRPVVCVWRSTRRPKRRLGREGAPLGQRGGAPLFVNLAGDEMALLIEMVVDLGMN